MSAQGRLDLFAEVWDQMQRERDGQARMAEWRCEDAWYVFYTTTRVVGGKHDGNFLAQLFKPVKKDGKIVAWVQEDRRVCGTRREARERAIKWYRAHSPKWDAKHPLVKSPGRP